MLGFNLGGILEGSTAAWFQSIFLKGTIGKGTIFSILQKFGAVGILQPPGIITLYISMMICFFLYKKLQD